MDSQVISALIAALGTIAGIVIGIWSQRQHKFVAALERRVDRYKAEIRARMAEEDVACDWLVEAGLAQTHRRAMMALRDRTEALKDLRPNMTPRDVFTD
jgi:hypothetical protein